MKDNQAKLPAALSPEAAGLLTEILALTHSERRQVLSMADVLRAGK